MPSLSNVILIIVNVFVDFRGACDSIVVDRLGYRLPRSNDIVQKTTESTPGLLSEIPNPV